MVVEKLEIIAPDRRKHGESAIDLIAKVFSGYRDYFTFGDAWRNRIYHGHYDWDASRIGIIDGEIVTHWGVWEYDMRIGAGCVRVGGIGVVATHAGFRKKGLMTRTARASIKAMREMGYDMTILFGIDDYYDKFGYVRAWSDETYNVKIKDLPGEKPSVKLRKFAVRQRDDLDRIYNRENSRFTGTAVRPTYIRNKYIDACDGYLWKDSRGRTMGYVVAAIVEGKFCCFEHGGDVEQALRVVSALGRRQGYEEVRFIGLPYDSALCKLLRRGNSRAEVLHSKCGGAMLHMLNLESTLRKISGEMSQRLGKSHLAKWRGGLLISGSREKTLLKIGNLKVVVSESKPAGHSVRGGEEVAQLIMGTDEPEEVVEAGRIRLAGDARDLIGVLFPNQHPTLALWDRY